MTSSRQEKIDPDLSLIILGCPNVGQEELLDGSYLDKENNNKREHFSTQIVDNKNVNIVIKEIYINPYPCPQPNICYSTLHGLILTFSFNDSESFKALRYSIIQAESLSKNMPIILIGNTNGSPTFDSKSESQVNISDVEAIVDEYGLNYYSIDASDKAKLKEIFDPLIKSALEFKQSSNSQQSLTSQKSNNLNNKNIKENKSSVFFKIATNKLKEITNILPNKENNKKKF